MGSGYCLGPVGRVRLVVLCAVAGVSGLVAGGCRSTDAIGDTNGRPSLPAKQHPRRVLAVGGLSEHYQLSQQVSPWLAKLTGKDQTGPQQLPRPLAIAVRGKQVVACDVSWNIAVVIDPIIGTVKPLIASGQPVPTNPVAVAVDDQYRTYVADAIGKVVFVVDASGTVIDRLALPDGDKPFGPVAAACGDGKLYVANAAGHCVEVFSLETREWIKTIGERGTGHGQMAFPVAVAVGADGRLYVVEMLNGRVQIFDASGEPIGAVGEPGNRLGQFARPRGVAVAPDGIIYVSDAATQVVQMFDHEGHLLMHFGGAGDDVGAMQLPAGVVVSEAMLNVVADTVPDGFDGKYAVLVANQMGRADIGVYVFGRVK